MKAFLILLIVALVASSIGFKKYVYFISLGYGFSISAIGITLLILFSKELTIGTILLSVLFIIYGIRLSGYLAYREIKSASYNKTMKKEIKDGKGMSIIAKSAIWITSALLYACETAPVLFRLENKKGTDAFAIVGLIIMILGLSLETLADFQKNKAKKINPNRFVDTGLFKLVRCPNYLGEMIFWTGVLFSGINSFNSFAAWFLSLVGYIGIIYVMFGGARRLEMRQNRNYGSDPEYQKYVSSTPIMLPFIPLYSVEKHKWLVA